jgi:hypothetical protein
MAGNGIKVGFKRETDDRGTIDRTEQNGKGSRGWPGLPVQKSPMNRLRQLLQFRFHPGLPQTKALAPCDPEVITLNCRR